VRIARFVGLAAWIAGTIACGSGRSSSAPTPPPATAVRVTTVAPSAMRGALSLTGSVEAEESEDVRPETQGQVAKIAFDHGQRVAAGDVLVRLRDAEARASVAEAEARLSLAATKLERTQGLFDRQNASRQDLDTARADRDLAQAAVDRAREQLRRTVVRAPFDGVVGLREVSVGEVVDPSRVLTRIESVDRLSVDVQVPERALPQVALGLPATVAVDALPGEEFAAEVTFVGPRVDATTRTAPVRVRVEDPERGLRPGMTARVELTSAEIPDALLVPTQAVVTGATGSSVWVVNAEGKAELRRVTTADRTAETVRVVDGLAPGERVIVEGIVRLRPGAAVRVLDGDGADVQ
jgi:membrane fusion protein (multidrug efflux system)